MVKNHYKLIENINDIKLNVQEFIRILEKERDSVVIQRFKCFDYWYYFSELKIFVPNKFLGYQNSAFEEYNPSPGNGQNGTKARKALSPYFNAVLDKVKFDPLSSELNKFAKKYGKNKKKEIKGIFEPINQYRNIFKNI